MTDGLTIVRLQAENFKKIRAVQVVPDPNGNLIVIAGANGAGKTSVLDAVWQTLGGAASARDTVRPIRDGESRAQVTVDLGGGAGRLRVTRTWTQKGTTLKVEAADGAKYSSPQAILDGLVGRLSFDPLAFAQQDSRAQLATLLGLIDLPFDLDQINVERQQQYEKRTMVGRTIKTLQGHLAGMPEPTPGLPTEEQSTSAVWRDYRAAETRKQANDEIRRLHRDAVTDTVVLQRRIDDLVVQLEQVTDLLAEAVQARDQLAERTAKLDDPDLDGFEHRAAAVEQTNAAIRGAKDYTRVAESLRDAKDTHDACSRRIGEIDQRKAAAIRDAAMPIDGLGFDDMGVTYRGIPFAQCSAAERLRVSLAMAMALNPQLRVIRITDGSLLDSANMRLVEEMARAKGFQVWLEVVNESGEVGVVIEDGLVVVSPPPVSAHDIRM